jgi:hypothetical protein
VFRIRIGFNADADPDQAFYLSADPDQYPDPNPGSHSNAGPCGLYPDPDLGQTLLSQMLDFDMKNILYVGIITIMS